MRARAPDVTDKPTVVIVGGGPAGLAAAIEIRRRGVDAVLVLERELHAGGIPRHAQHQGFGIRDLHRAMSGPRYAERYALAAAEAGAAILTETMVTDWAPGGPLELTGPRGRRTVEPMAVVLATGCRERPRSARLVPGTRPQGVITTGTLQQLVYLQGRRVGERALVVGAEHVSFSAVATLAHGGARTVALVTELPRHQSLALAPAGVRIRYGAKVWTRTRVSAIHGRPWVEAVDLTDLDTGAVRQVDCDTVVFTADWIPDQELAVMAGIELDPGTLGPAVDPSLRTSRPSVFAAGNILHGAEPADVAALGGRHAAAATARFLAGYADWPASRLPIVCHSPLHWISPNALSPGCGPPPRARFALRAGKLLSRPLIEISQGGRTLWSRRLRRLVPGRSAGLPTEWVDRVAPEAGAVEVSVHA